MFRHGAVSKSRFCWKGHGAAPGVHYSSWMSGVIPCVFAKFGAGGELDFMSQGHGVSHEPFSLLILVEKIMVVLVSFQFHSISAFEVWTFGLVECAFLLGIPFGHSLGMYLSKCPLFGVLVFWATRATTPRPAPRVAWARKLWFSPKRVLRRSAVRFISSGTR